MGGMSGAGMGGGGAGDEMFGGKFINTYYNYQQQTQGYKANSEYWDAYRQGNVANGYVYDSSKDTVSQTAFESGDYGNVNWRYLKEQGWTLEQIQEYNPGIVELEQDNALPEWVTTASEMNPKTQGQETQTSEETSQESEGTYDRTPNTRDRQTLEFDNLGISNVGNREGVTYDEYGNASINSSYFTEDRGWSPISAWTSSSGSPEASSAYYYNTNRNKNKGKGSSQNRGTGAAENQVWGWLNN